MKQLTLILGFLILFSCGDKKNEYEPMADNSGQRKAEVKEVILAQSYTYLRVEEADGEYWLATGNTEVEKGDEIYFNNFVVMNDFESKELDKTFEQILFVDNISEEPITEEIQASKEKDPHRAKSSDYQKMLDSIKIPPVKGGMTIKQVYENAESLDKKELVVRGQVIKINRDIMNRNWVHIMDGTKSERSDLTFTSQEDFQIGDTVTVKGTIAVEKEYGAGYVYPVILEDAVRQ